MAEPIKMPFGVLSGFGPSNSVLLGGDDARRGRCNCGENVPDKPDFPMNGELDWSMQRHAHDKGRHLIATVGQVLSATKYGWCCTSRAKSGIYDCLV